MEEKLVAEINKVVDYFIKPKMLTARVQLHLAKIVKGYVNDALKEQEDVDTFTMATDLLDAAMMERRGNRQELREALRKAVEGVTV